MVLLCVDIFSIHVCGQVMKNQEAVDHVKKVRDPQVAAKMLTDEALVRKSKDDISCIVVRLH